MRNKSFKGFTLMGLCDPWTISGFEVPLKDLSSSY